MNVDAILVSDFAETIGDKLVIVGTFSRIRAKQFPAAHPMMAVSLIVHGHSSEAGRSFDLKIHLLNGQREDVVPPLEMRASFPKEVPPAGFPVRVQLAYQLIGVRFGRPGAYAFEVYIDGTYHASASLLLVQG